MRRSTKSSSKTTSDLPLTFDLTSSSSNNGNDSADMTTPSSEFDQLRREATKLERQLEDRVSKYQLFSTNGGGDSASLDYTEMGLSSRQNGAPDNNHEALASEIQRTMSALGNLTGNMANIAKRTNSSQHSLLVKRYREILFDYKADFEKAAQAVQKRRETAALFHGAGRNGSLNNEDGGATEHLLRERNAINNSIKSADTVLSQASEIRANLRTQRNSLGVSMGYVSNIASNVPGLNHVMDAIRRKRSRDDLILSGVIATCILFTLWYLFG
uniref:Golgi SNAP receptor complex member 1 n=1 Tax=Leptocylindrus danicus TaxID=163516 RepID=A0A7S2NX08_9STRA|mmetsp:Transcript_16325/g.24065  ORF Transcript_16325/g.24065 Transcript_16325/m.24065 type:complete len:272 (+) Transcript_16325:133-948(+)